MFAHKKRTTKLKSIGLNAQYYASFLGDERYMGGFHVNMKVATSPGNFEIIRGHRMNKLRRPLYIGTDGVIYIKVRCQGVVVWEKALLRKRDLDGMDRIDVALKRGIVRLLHKSPGSMQYEGCKKLV